MTSFNFNQFLAIAIACTCGLGAYAFIEYKTHAENTRELEKQHLSAALQKAAGFLEKTQALRALSVLNDNQERLKFYPEFESKKNEISLESAMHSGDDALIFKLWLLDSKPFKNQEPLSLRAANHALSIQDLNNYQKLSEEWKISGKQAKNWLLLDADALILMGQSQNALELLTKTQLHGDAEISRLIRLALLSENEHPKISWEYLLKALKIDPHRSDLHLFRAQILESSGQNGLAEEEYKAALAKSPKDPLYKEELIEFYLREQKTKEAFASLQLGLNSQGSDKLWLKTLFLNKVYQPSKLELAKESIPVGVTTSFIRYLLAVPTNEFWSESLLASQPAVEQIAEQIPEAAWLQVFEQLSLNHDSKALEILQRHPEMAALNPLLYEGLQNAIAIHYPSLKPQNQAMNLKYPSFVHPVFTALKNPILPAEYAALMESKESYAALTLASGWYEAALNLYPSTKYAKHSFSPEISSEFPRWVAFGYAKALIANRTKEESLAFIRKQPPSPQLSLLAAELHFNLKNYDEVEKTLTPLAKSSSNLGVKAALLLSKSYAEQKNFARAKQTLLDNSELHNSLAGKEALARLELSFGHLPAAEEIYATLRESSSEAKAFLAKRAFQLGDYKTAYQLTKSLLEQFPDQKDLKNSLHQIKQALSKK